MNDLILKGIAEVEDMKFTHIEGGFGKNKRSMLLKDIALIHNKPLKHVNELVNNNCKRFKENIDIIDLKGRGFEVGLNDHGIYTQNAINRSNNIYVLSERGYAKLLKILEDDFAWEQYEKLVDGYFNMRSQIKQTNMPTYPEALRLYADTLEEKEQLKIENSQQQEVIEELKPQAEYTKKILKSKSIVNINQIAKDYGMSAQEMNKLLHKQKVQYKQGDQWLLYKKHQNKGYVHSETIDFMHKDGTPDVKMRTKWTQKGRLFIYSLLKQNGILPMIEKNIGA